MYGNGDSYEYQITGNVIAAKIDVCYSWHRRGNTEGKPCNPVQSITISLLSIGCDLNIHKCTTFSDLWETYTNFPPHDALTDFSRTIAHSCKNRKVVFPKKGQ